MTKISWTDMTIHELEAEVRHHNKLYFEKHSPEISDYEFDRLVEELRKRKPDSSVLAELVSDARVNAKKVRHEVPMLSLDKCYDEKSLTDWAGKFEGKIVASPKIDGCAVSIVYGNDGKLIRAATRGDGVEGEEITANVGFVGSIPQKISEKNVEVRGEIYMPLSVFAKFKGEFANPRNLAAGAIKQKDPRKTGSYHLSFFAYDLLGAGDKSEESKFTKLKKNGFVTVEWHLVSKDKMQEEFNDFFARREKFDFELDGVVLKANDVLEQKRLGLTAHHPRYAIAYKFQGDSGTTTLNDVEWSVARTGVITPVAIVEPVELSGAMVRRASLHNVGILSKLGITIGSKVLMVRRGGVIPHLESVVEKGGRKVEIPKRCPSCGGKVRIEDDFLYCENPKSCVQSKVGEIEHFVKTVGIDGFGDKLITKLYEEGFVTDPSELYELTKDELMNLERMGDVLAEKLIANVKSKTTLSLDVFLQSLGIRELGKHASKLLAEHGTLKNVMALSEEELSSIKTIGPVIAHEVVDGFSKKKIFIERLLKHVRVVEFKRTNSSWKFAGKSFLFTGSLISMQRSDAQEKVEELGGIAAQSVSKDLDYLVVGDGGGVGGKLDKAKKLEARGCKVRIISEKEFMKMTEG